MTKKERKKEDRLKFTQKVSLGEPWASCEWHRFPRGPLKKCYPLLVLVWRRGVRSGHCRSCWHRSQLQLGFDPWPGTSNIHMLRVWQKKKKKNLPHTPDLLDAYSHSVHRNFFIPKLSIYTSLPHLQDWACGHRAHFTDWETDAKEPAIREEFLEQSSQASPPQGGGALLISISLPTEPALPFR